MSRTRLVPAGQIECSRKDGAACAIQRHKEQFESDGLEIGGEPWTDNGYERLTFAGKHVNELADGTYQVVGTNEILTPVRKPR